MLLIQQVVYFQHILDGAVGVDDVQPGKSAELIGEVMVVGNKADVTDGPALAHADGQGVFGGQQGSDIIGLVLDPLLVGGPAGGQDIFTNTLAVEHGDISAHSGGAEGGLLHRLGSGEGLLEGTGGNAGIHGGSDPDSILFHKRSPYI